MKKLILAVSALLAMTIAAEAQQISVTSPSQALKLEFRGAKAVASDVELTFLVTNLSENEAVINLVGGQYQNGGFYFCSTELPKHCKAVLFRHHDIKDDPVVVTEQRIIECVLTVIDRINGVMTAFQNLDQRFR